ncbi:hypothetical protein POV26_03240 [Aequorivita todarodis]|uniref:hypothetical protein n=1 Tax=Aequorivita todarodis TaxID=2036821 RepID=UPI002350397D|nr:hypothetical protein [Aequorivita todarodis]MDC8000038.1 hypothetical protein [Aequorivita todarodis]
MGNGIVLVKDLRKLTVSEKGIKLLRCVLRNIIPDISVLHKLGIGIFNWNVFFGSKVWVSF